jgi:hypothetical protein
LNTNVRAARALGLPGEIAMLGFQLDFRDYITFAVLFFLGAAFLALLFSFGNKSANCIRSCSCLHAYVAGEPRSDHMQVNIEIDLAAKSLKEGDGAALRLLERRHTPLGSLLLTRQLSNSGAMTS